MKIFVAGASGAIGLPLVQLLVSKKHEVIGMTRSPAKGKVLEQLGATAVVADVFDPAALERVVREVAPTHMVHLLTAIPKNGPMRPSDMAATNRLRTVGTANLLQAAIAAGVKRIVGESFMTVYGYGKRDGEWRTEADPLPEQTANGGIEEVVTALRSLEQQFLAANQQGLIEAIPLRYGMIYGPENSATQYMVQMVRKRMLPTFSGLTGVSSFVHIADAVSATLAALERGLPGEIYNIVDDEPVSMNHFITALASATGAKRPFSIPLWLMRWMAPVMVATISADLPLSNAKAKRELGWKLQFPSYKEGVQDVARYVQDSSPLGQTAPGVAVHK